MIIIMQPHAQQQAIEQSDQLGFTEFLASYQQHRSDVPTSQPIESTESVS